MSGGSAFYVLIYAIFYFVNKVLLFLLYESATFLEEMFDLGKEMVGCLVLVCPCALLTALLEGREGCKCLRPLPALPVRSGIP